MPGVLISLIPFEAISRLSLLSFVSSVATTQRRWIATARQALSLAELLDVFGHGFQFFDSGNLESGTSKMNNPITPMLVTINDASHHSVEQPGNPNVALHFMTVFLDCGGVVQKKLPFKLLNHLLQLA
jgi:hypothetical protein